jgi:parallel beta-helix repeat protein
VKTGTTWEDYYRYDPEQAGNGNVVPTTSKLLFRESGTPDPGNFGNGFLVDGVSLASSLPTCTPTGFFRDGINMTAAQIGGNVTGQLDASGCNIGAYFDSTHPGSVSGAEIYGANYFGVVDNGAAVNVSASKAHDIGETPFNGAQHGNAIYYTNGATGTISGNTVSHYQKNGITAVNGSSVTISGNTVTGEGPVTYIAQNGIEVGSGAKATVSDNTVSGNAYTGPNGASSGGILVFGGPFFGGVPYTTGVQVSHNTLTNNDVGIYLYNADALGNAPKTQTKNGAVNNTITSSLTNSNATGCSASMGYQAGVSEFGNKDNIVNNKISGTGYLPASNLPSCSGAAAVWKTPIDTSGSQAAHISNNK